jgi:hypothetical protein
MLFAADYAAHVISIITGPNHLKQGVTENGDPEVRSL